MLVDIRDYWQILRKRWIAIVLFTVLGGGAAYAFSALATPVYSTTATGFVSIGGSSQQESYSGANFALQRVKSYVELVDSPQVLQPVIDELGLDTTVPELAKQVSATNPPQTVLLNVTVTGTDPVEITTITNAVAVQYADQIEQIEETRSTVVVDGKKRKVRIKPIKVTIATPADVPQSPISPRTNVNVALGLILGLGLGIAWAVLRDQLDNTVKSPSELRELTGATSLGVIGFDPKAKESPLVALDQQARRAEAFRTIRTNLQYVDVDNPPRVVAITSPVPGEGKTTTACNLAITLAQSGKSVCLVEGDMRRPKVAEYLGVESAIGLTNVLTGEAGLDEVLLGWHRDLITVLPVGPIPPNPSELLSSQHMRHTLDELRARFDIVIIDAAPVLPVADGAIVAAAADGAVLIVRYGEATRDQVAGAKESLDQVGARMLGVVLNFAPTKKRSGYGYGYGYGTEDAESERSFGKRKRGSRNKPDGAPEATVPAPVASETEPDAGGVSGATEQSHTDRAVIRGGSPPTPVHGDGTKNRA